MSNPREIRTRDPGFVAGGSPKRISGGHRSGVPEFSLMYSFHFLEARDSYDPLNLSHPLRLGTRVEPVVVTGAGSEGAREGCRMKGKRDHTVGG